MKQATFSLLFYFITTISFGQEVFKDACFIGVKEGLNGYISILKGANDYKLNKYLVNKNDDFYTQGVALHDKNGKIVWVKIISNRLIFDIQSEKKKVRILNAEWNNSKSCSNAKLFETLIDDKGEFISEKVITSASSDFPNLRIHGFYEKNGSILEWVNWQNFNVTINNELITGCQFDNIQIRKHIGNDIQSILLQNEQLKLLAYDTFNNNTGFIYSVKPKQENNQFKEKTIQFIEINNKGIKSKEIPLATQNVYIKHLKLNRKGFIVSGSFQGNDTLNYKPTAYILDQALISPKNLFRDETARNGFIASINTTSQINWLNILKSDYDVSLKSMDTDIKTIGIGIEYKDFIHISSHIINSLKDSSHYEYSDAALLFFNRRGKLITHEQMYGIGYENIGAYLMKSKIILYGEFLNYTKIFDIEHKYETINTCNFFLFRDKAIMRKKH